MADKVLSRESGVAPYETFFHDFDLEAFSFFNYWTADEGTNDTLMLENRDINDMPRFVKVVWNSAPDLPEQKSFADKVSPTILKRSSEGPGIPGAREQFIVDGIKYSPEQLRPKDFSTIAPALANADISPGVIKSVVTMPLISSGITRPPPPYRVDLDTWYSDTRSRGVPISHVRNTFNNRASGIFNLPTIYKAGVSARNGAAFSELFSGNFAVSPSSFVRRSLAITAASPKSPALGLSAAAATVMRPRVAEPAESIFDTITYARHAPRTNSIRVAFVDTGVGNTVAPSRVNVATDAAHANAISATAQVLRHLITYSESGLQNAKRKITLRSFEAPNGLAPKEYVGYLLEKYEQVDGVFVLKEIIGIGDPYVDEYYDTKVRYGGVYRYRIRSVMRWVRPKNVGATGTDNTIINDLSTSDPSQAIASTSLTPNFASYFGSEWSKNWATAHIIDDEPPNPPDQLTVLPQSEKKRIVITFQIPENSQRDIWQMTLYRKVIDRNGRDAQPWTELADFDMSRGGYYEDYDVRFIPKGVSESGQPFRYIYAATSWSVHNGESKLSEQIGARLNSDWKERGEYSVEFYSSRGVDRVADHGVFSTVPIKQYKTHIVANPRNELEGNQPGAVHIGCQERWGTRMLSGNSFILRLHSLDTGEFFDVDFSTDVVSLEPQKIQAPSDIYVPSANEQYVYDDQALTSG